MRERWKVGGWPRWNRTWNHLLTKSRRSCRRQDTRITTNYLTNAHESRIRENSLVRNSWLVKIRVSRLRRDWLRAFCRTSQRVWLSDLSKPLRGEGVAKASFNRAFVRCSRPEAWRAYHVQDEPLRKRRGGPNPWVVQSSGMTCGKEWKANRVT